MFKTITTGALAALMILLLAPGVQAQAGKGKAPTESVAELEQKVQQAYQDKNWIRMYSYSMNLHKQRPFVPEYMLYIVLASASLNKPQTAYHYMLKMQQQGLNYDFNQYPETESIRGTEAFDYITDLSVKAGLPSGEGAKFLDLDVVTADLGDVAWDESRGRFLVGTRTDGNLLSVSDNGKSEVLLRANDENGLWSIDGIETNVKSNRLWIASTATPAFRNFTPADANRGALFEFDLQTLELLNRYNLPVDALPHELGGIAVTDAGDVYVIDRATPIIYRKTVDGNRLEAFAGSAQLVALTDIAVTPDNSRIFVADAVMGILLIDPIAQRSMMLAGPETLNLSGIYGIEYINTNLIVTQSGISPQRIMRLQLNPAGAAVGGVTPMASSLEGFDTPGVGTLRGESLYYFANHGTRKPDQELLMMASPLSAGNEVKPPDMNQFGEAFKNTMDQQQQ
jgi:hypothetical protein